MTRNSVLRPIKMGEKNLPNGNESETFSFKFRLVGLGPGLHSPQALLGLPPPAKGQG